MSFDRLKTLSEAEGLRVDTTPRSYPRFENRVCAVEHSKVNRRSRPTLDDWGVYFFSFESREWPYKAKLFKKVKNFKKF